MVGVRVAVLVAVLVIAGCGSTVTPQPGRPSPPTTRPAGDAFELACARAVKSVSIAVLCPAQLPLGGFKAPRDYGDAPCTYLVNLEPRVLHTRAGGVFHLLFGATCRLWTLSTRDGRWPVDPGTVHADGDLRLVGATSLEPGDTEADRKRVGLRVLARVPIRSTTALVLRNPPYPVGGIHGGHVTVIWNEGGAGLVVTGHAVASRTRPDGSPGLQALRRATRTLLRVAASMRPAASADRAALGYGDDRP